MRPIVSLALTCSLVTAAACDLDSATSEPLDRAAFADTESESQRPPPPPGPPALSMLVAAAADEVGGLDDAQRDAIEVALAALHEGHALGRDDHEALRLAIADGLSGCVFESGAIEEASAEVIATAGVHAQDDADTLDELHAILDASQRGAALDVLAQIEPPPHGPGGAVRELARSLELSDAQIESVHDLLGDEGPRRVGDGEPDGPAVVLAGFAGDDFSAADLELGTHARQRATARTAEFVAVVGALCAVLDDEQRDVLDASLRSAPQPPPEGHRPPPPRG
jgi:hypothetical protein